MVIVELMKKSIAALALVFAATGCLHVHSEAPKLVLHGDTSFEAWDRSCINTAADKWRDQTNGLADVDFIFDHNPGSEWRPDQNRLVRWTSTMGQTLLEDARVATETVPGGFILGEVTVVQGKLEMRLVPDRFDSDKVCRLTVMHEIGHLFAMPHASEKPSIMYPLVLQNRTECLKLEDLLYFCGTNDCGNTQMLPCDKPWVFPSHAGAK